MEKEEQKHKGKDALKNGTRRELRIGEVSLTSRELDCLEWCVEGKTATETAEYLGISKRTVENHLARVKIKFNCRKKSDLVVKLLDIKPFTDAIGLYQDKKEDKTEVEAPAEA